MKWCGTHWVINWELGGSITSSPVWSVVLAALSINRSAGANAGSYRMVAHARWTPTWTSLLLGGQQETFLQLDFLCEHALWSWSWKICGATYPTTLLAYQMTLPFVACKCVVESLGLYKLTERHGKHKTTINRERANLPVAGTNVFTTSWLSKLCAILCFIYFYFTG